MKNFFRTAGIILLVIVIIAVVGTVLVGCACKRRRSTHENSHATGSSDRGALRSLFLGEWPRQGELGCSQHLPCPSARLAWPPLTVQQLLLSQPGSSGLPLVLPLPSAAGSAAPAPMPARNPTQAPALAQALRPARPASKPVVVVDPDNTVELGIAAQPPTRSISLAAAANGGSGREQMWVVQLDPGSPRTTSQATGSSPRSPNCK